MEAESRLKAPPPTCQIMENAIIFIAYADTEGKIN